MILDCRMICHDDIYDGSFRGDVGVFKKIESANISLTEGNFFDGYLISGNNCFLDDIDLLFNEDKYFKAYYIEGKNAIIEITVDDVEKYKVYDIIELSIDDNYECLFEIIAIQAWENGLSRVKLVENRIFNKNNQCGCGCVLENHHNYCWKCGKKVNRNSNRYVERHQ